MKSFSEEKENLSGNDISEFIKNKGWLKELWKRKPIIFIPDVVENNYTYFEDDSNGNLKLKSPPLGINKNNNTYVENSLFVLVNDNFTTNGIATIAYDYAIVGVYTGSIINIQHNANLIIGTMFESDFDNYILKYEKENIVINENALELNGKNTLLGFKDERILSFIQSEVALRFLVLHEIGHHVIGHTSELLKNENFVLLKADGEINTEKCIKVDKINIDKEIEADIWAAKALVNEFDLIILGLEKSKSDLLDMGISNSLEIKTLALKMIIYAITLSFSTFFNEKDVKYIDINLPKLKLIAKREIMVLLTITSHLYEKCREATIFELHNLTKEQQQEISQTLDIERMDFEDFMKYISTIFFEGKHLYYKVNKVLNIDQYFQIYYHFISELNPDSK